MTSHPPDNAAPAVLPVETPPPEAKGGDVLLLGNLQTGKTVLFHRLCGERASYVRIPESSSDLERGRLRVPGMRRGRRQRAGGPTPVHLVDAPGTVSLIPQSEEEQLVRTALLQLRPETLLLVADARNLRRSLALFLEAAEFGLPMVVALNMVDRAEAEGIEVDADLLEHHLGVPVVATVAREGLGVPALAQALGRARRPHRRVILPRAVEDTLADLEEHLGDLPSTTRGVALLLLAGDGEAEREVARSRGDEVLQVVRERVAALRAGLRIPVETILADAWLRTAERIAASVVTPRPPVRGLAETFGRLARHPGWGLLIAALVVALAYLWVGVVGATWVVDGLDRHLFQGVLTPFFDRVVGVLPWPVAREAIMDPEFGLLPTGLFLAFGLVMPVLFFFHVAFGLLRDSGYLPRLSILLDRTFRAVGLNGRAVLPLSMGLSCVTMALLTTRMLESRKERTIASFLLLLGMPCAPLLSVMLVVLRDLPFSATAFVMAAIVTQMAVAGHLLGRILPGRVSDFIMELPPIRMPHPGQLLLRSAHQTVAFVKEAVPFFLVASLVLFAADRAGGLLLLEHVAHPVVHGVLGLPDESLQVFIKTIIRRENGATELDLVRGGFTPLQVVVTLLVMTFITPCVNAVLVLVRERGAALAGAMVLTAATWAVLVGAAVHHGCRWLGVTFQ